MFGSNFVPVKRVYTGDGMFFTLMMTAAVFYEGCFIQLWQGNPKFEPVAMLGGALWATGNITVVPIVKTIGLGIGLLVWGLVSMLVGWASGHFGIFGVEPDPNCGRTWLNCAGRARHRVLGVYAKIKSRLRRVPVRAPTRREGTGPASARPPPGVDAARLGRRRGGVRVSRLSDVSLDSAPDEWGAGATRSNLRASSVVYVSAQ